MNLIPLAALLIASLAFATAITAIVLVERLRRHPRQRQVTIGPGAIQIQAGGDLATSEERYARAADGAITAPSSGLRYPKEMFETSDVAEAAAQRIIKSGRHL